MHFCGLWLLKCLLDVIFVFLNGRVSGISKEGTRTE